MRRATRAHFTRGEKKRFPLTVINLIARSRAGMEKIITIFDSSARHLACVCGCARARVCV